jgi:hypothetical protein
MRDSSGQFLKGQSGNPGGRPRVILAVRDQAQQHGEEAISVLASIMRDCEAPPSARISAASEILNRGYGRPVDQKAMFVMSQQIDRTLVPREMTTRDIIDELARLSRERVIDVPALAELNN